MGDGGSFRPLVTARTKERKLTISTCAARYLQAGQILVDKAKHLDALLLAEWMMDRERFSYWFKCVAPAAWILWRHADRALLSSLFAASPTCACLPSARLRAGLDR